MMEKDFDPTESIRGFISYMIYGSHPDGFIWPETESFYLAQVEQAERIERRLRTPCNASDSMVEPEPSNENSSR